MFGRIKSFFRPSNKTSVIIDKNFEDIHEGEIPIDDPLDPQAKAATSTIFLS